MQQPIAIAVTCMLALSAWFSSPDAQQRPSSEAKMAQPKKILGRMYYQGPDEIRMVSGTCQPSKDWMSELQCQAEVHISKIGFGNTCTVTASTWERGFIQRDGAWVEEGQIQSCGVPLTMTWKLVPVRLSDRTAYVFEEAKEYRSSKPPASCNFAPLPSKRVYQPI